MATENQDEFAHEPPAVQAIINKFRNLTPEQEKQIAALPPEDQQHLAQVVAQMINLARQDHSQSQGKQAPAPAPQQGGMDFSSLNSAILGK